MKTSSVEFISRSPNPLPMKSEHRRFCVAPKNFEPWQWKRRKKRNRFEQTSELYRGKYRCVQPKINLLKKRRTYACETQCFPVEPSGCRRDSLWSPWKYRCGQRTVRMAVMACSQNQAVFARRRSELKLKLELVEEKQKLLDIRERKKENARGARAGVTF
ncbi:hypothetical protein TNCV_1567951 [Trichonephila clavipes]|nr:hypothetical protein TNCV_1567951 [Trichonephila clavipes]